MFRCSSPVYAMAALMLLPALSAIVSCPAAFSEQDAPAGQQPPPAPAQPAVIRMQVQIFHVPSDSTFFWDRNVIHLKRRNPQGEGIPEVGKLNNMRQALVGQGGRLIASSSISFTESRSASMQIRMPDHSFYLEIGENGFKPEDNSLEMSIDVGQLAGTGVLKPTDLSGKWQGVIPEGRTLYLVLRSRDPMVTDNFVVFLHPSRVQQANAGGK